MASFGDGAPAGLAAHNPHAVGLAPPEDFTLRNLPESHAPVDEAQAKEIIATALGVQTGRVASVARDRAFDILAAART
eukprot:3943218-Alexandrium_andersonii.AAC.1